MSSLISYQTVQPNGNRRLQGVPPAGNVPGFSASMMQDPYITLATNYFISQ